MPTAETEKTETEKPTRAFLTKLYAKIKEMVGDKFSSDDFDSAVKHARGHAGGMQKAKNRAPEAASEMSLTRKIEMINSALSDSFKKPFSNESYFYYAREIFDNYVIVCSNDDGKYYRIPYTVNGDEVSFDEPVEVEQTFAPVSASEGVNLLDLCADGHGTRLFNTLQEYAEPPEWIPCLPKPGTYTSPRYGEIKITEERIENFVKNFESRVYQQDLPITLDIEHDGKMSGAVGKLKAIRVNEDGSADAQAEWTERGRTLLKEDRFGYFSPEWWDKWTDPATEQEYSDVLIGGALTVRPFFKEKALRPLVASERGLETTETDPKDLPTSTTVVFTALAPVIKEANKMAEPVATAEKTGAEKEGKPATEPQSFAELKAELEAERAARQASEEKATKLEERTASLEKEGRTKRFSDIIRDSENNGAKRFIGDEAKHLGFMEKLSEAFGETSDEVKHYVTDQQAHAEQVRQSNLFKEVGRTDGGAAGSAYAEIESKARAMCEKDPKLTQEQAIAQVSQNEPALYRRYLAEQSE